jgi:hypothetical protein
MEIVWMIFGSLLGFVALGIIAAAFYLPFYLYRKWEGRWKFVALLPLAFALGDLLFIVVGISIDPTSHNLWPLELIMASVFGIASLGVVFVIRKITDAIGTKKEEKKIL